MFKNESFRFSGDSQDPNRNCPIDLEDELKFDCYPEGNAAEVSCLNRGCCWSPTEKQSVPYCYYPSNYALYSFVNITPLEGSRYNGVVILNFT